MNSLFQNHELYKITTGNPLATPAIIYVVLFLLALVWKEEEQKNEFLCRHVTVQMRGVAILLVIVGHIGVHILNKSQQSYFPVVGQYGVSIFFVLSGFGLALSYTGKPLRVGDFIKRRLSRVMLPYWIATALILFLDSMFLGRSYAVTDVLATVLGFNGSSVTRSIDYVRWYITVLLLWYTFFVLFWPVKNKSVRALCFVGAGALLIFLDYYLYTLGYAYLSFPFGVVVGLYFDEINNWYRSFSKAKLMLVAVVIIFGNYLFRNFLLETLDFFMPTIGMAFISECCWLVITSCSIVIFSCLMPKVSLLLSLVGKYSYGLFLIHGALMIKYDFILFRYPLVVSFWMSFALVLAVAIIMEKFLFKNVYSIKF